WNTCTGNRTFMQYPWGGGLAFSPAHWPADGMMGERIAIMASQLAAADTVAPWNQDDKLPGNLVWIDTQSTAITTNNGQPWPTQGTAYGYMQHTGDLGGVAFPTWSNDGNTIVRLERRRHRRSGRAPQPGDDGPLPGSLQRQGGRPS